MEVDDGQLLVISRGGIEPARKRTAYVGQRHAFADLWQSLER